MSKRPIIGIAPGYSKDNDRIYIGKDYIDAINEAGGIAVVLPLTADRQLLDELLESCQGFLIPGGPDLDARIFGEENLPCNGKIIPERDEMEIELVKKALSRGKALLGICRGIQLLNVALGGTLYQDIYQQHNDKKLLKHWQEAPDWYPIHSIRIQENSFIADCFGVEDIAVNSYHHQAVKELGKNLKATAISPDGIIEAIEHEKEPFAVGVQWHPESMWKRDKKTIKLFEGLVKASMHGGKYATID